MEGFKEKPVTFSKQYILDTDNIYSYGLEAFGEVQAKKYENLIDKIASELAQSYWMYPECRHLLSKKHIYQNIILEAHLIIYRICSEKIEVLRVLHSKSSISRIRTVRKIKI